MIIDHLFLDSITEEAKKSPRLRMNKDMRTSTDDQSQRMFNALEPGTVLPIHRHRKTTETILCVRGSLRVDYYDDNAIIKDSYFLGTNSDAIAIQIPVGQWHSAISLESGTVMFECKDGPYEPLSPKDVLRD